MLRHSKNIFLIKYDFQHYSMASIFLESNMLSILVISPLYLDSLIHGLCTKLQPVGHENILQYLHFFPPVISVQCSLRTVSLCGWAWSLGRSGSYYLNCHYSFLFEKPVFAGDSPAGIEDTRAWPCLCNIKQQSRGSKGCFNTYDFNICIL